MFLLNARQTFSSSPEARADLVLQSLWFNKYIQTEDNPTYLTKFAARDINFLTRLFEKGNLKSWGYLKFEYNFPNETFFPWLQLKHAIPHKWKKNIKQNSGNVSDLLIQDHHLIKVF